MKPFMLSVSLCLTALASGAYGLRCNVGTKDDLSVRKCKHPKAVCTMVVMGTKDHKDQLVCGDTEMYMFDTWCTPPESKNGVHIPYASCSDAPLDAVGRQCCCNWERCNQMEGANWTTTGAIITTTTTTSNETRDNETTILTDEATSTTTLEKTTTIDAAAKAKADKDKNSSGLPTGAIVGIIIGVLLIAVVIVVVVVVALRAKKKKKAHVEESEGEENDDESEGEAKTENESSAE